MGKSQAQELNLFKSVELLGNLGSELKNVNPIEYLSSNLNIKLKHER